MMKRSYRSKRFAFVEKFLVLAIAVGGAALGGGRSEAQGLPTIQDILRAHNAWPVAPGSVEMIGTSMKNGTPVPFKATATHLEEALVEYGERKQVISPQQTFQDDGKTVTYAKAPSGFSQLDVTGLFFIAQLQQKPASVSPPEKVELKGIPVYRVHVLNDRSQIHFGMSRVKDEFDLYVTESGILAGISRLFYDDQPFRYTQTYLFSDYRETDKVLLPYRIEVYLKGRLTETIQIASYTFEISTPTTLFQPRRTR
jgi:hypothetical protein